MKGFVCWLVVRPVDDGRANLDSAIRVRPIARSSGMLGLSVNEALGTIGVVLLVTLPWILGGFDPTREDFTWAILIAFLIGFLSISALVLSAFDLARLDAGEIVQDDDQPPSAETEPIPESHGVMDRSGADPKDPESEAGDPGPVREHASYDERGGRSVQSSNRAERHQAGPLEVAAMRRRPVDRRRLGGTG